MSERSAPCPKCGQDAASVERITLKALLTSDGLRRGIPAQPRFCATAGCQIVYFDGDVTFTESELIVPVFPKHADDPETLVCYCFAVDIATMRDPSKARETRESIAREVQAGHCACEVKNPKGGCCLGDLLRFERGQHREVTVSSCCTVS
jgi:hypothetical protein